MSNIIEVKELSKEYFPKTENSVKAINNLSFEVETGKLVAICGVSGSGKSTLLKLLCGIIRPDAGKILINGQDITQYSDSKISSFRNEEIGFVFQNYALIPDKTAEFNVRIPLVINGGYSRKEENKMIELAFELVGFKQPKKRVSLLSGGEKQRVAIARAIVNNPSIILADEPTGALDKENKLKIVNLFKELQKTGKTIIIVTHDESIADSCDVKISISDGSLV